ncbi:unnamed protein product [marine sediment metagenome]|uniref:Uncharacterized protein n=1 Tax=marine sediment metagenome TaxID=412755 RepID=X1BTX6_9ZZZZ
MSSNSNLIIWNKIIGNEIERNHSHHCIWCGEDTKHYCLVCDSCSEVHTLEESRKFLDG